MNPQPLLYLTYRSEYLVLRDLCVGVRERGSGQWQTCHAAACAHVLGPLRTTESSMLAAARVRIGDRLCFYAPVRRVITGPIVAVERPSQDVLNEADRRWRSLFAPEDVRHTAIMLVPKE